MPGNSVLIAFGFGNLAMLGWLAAAAAPLLIHLWSRHRFREAPWAAMQFLLAAMRKNARRMQLQQWLLLAVRTLIIGLVVLAVAEPYGEQLLAGGSGTPTHKILVIDDSYSMDYRDENTSRFVRAKQAAAQLVRDSRPADAFTVILMAGPSQTVLGNEVIDHATVVAQIEGLTQRYTSANIAEALTLAQEAIKSNKSRHKYALRHEVHFFTDLQRTTWQPGSDAERESESQLKTPLTSLAEVAALSVIDVGQSNAGNLAVTRLSTPDAVVTLSRETAFDAVLHQFGNQPRSQCAVELLIDDVPVAEQIVDIPAGGDAVARFVQRFQSPGEHAIEVRAAGDRLAIDNSRWLVVPVREEMRVLCVAGRDGAAKYVADALNPNPAGESPIRPVVISEADLADIELSGFDCIFVCNVGQFTSSEGDRLRRYVAAGGGIVFLLGDRVLPQSYNGLTKGPRPLIPARLSEVIYQDQFGLDPLEYRHPIVAPFRGRERAGLLTTPVARYYRLDVSKSRPEMEIAAAMRNGDPFIIAAPLGLGRTVVVATDGSLASVDASTGEPWTNWPTWPSFLPIVRELLTYASSGRQQQWQAPVGTPLARRGVSVSGKAANVKPDDLKVARPDGGTASVSMQSTPTGWEWSYSDTDVAGIYSLRGLPNAEPLQFAVNVDTTESDLTRVEARQLPLEMSVRGSQHQATESSGVTAVSHAGWNESLLWVALSFLFVESFLAWQFGRGKV